MKSNLKLTILVIALGLLWAGAANAAQVNPPQSGFTVTGFIQEATLNLAPITAGSSPGGTITVNGVKIIIPDNLVVQMPAAAFSWAQMFNPTVSASFPAGRPNHRFGQTGLALADNPLSGTRAGVAGAVGPFPSFEVTVQGNITFNAAGKQTYIAALILPISQQSLNLGAGIINQIDYATGRFRVGGDPTVPNSGVLCEINDKPGRFGKAHSPDPRFTADTNNPTISTGTGYPVGIPVTDPAVADDPLRPKKNRPLSGGPSPALPPAFTALGIFLNPDPFVAPGDPLRNFVMPNPGTRVATDPDPSLQVPLMVGDWVDYSGTLFKINPAGPNTAANMFVSVHTLTADLGIYTWPGTLPVYVNCTALLFGTNGPNPVPGPFGQAPGRALPVEVTTRILFEGFATDPFGATGGGAFVYAFAVNTNSGGNDNYVFISNPNIGSANQRENPSPVEVVAPLGRFRIRPGKITFYGPPITNLNNMITREYLVVHQNILTNAASLSDANNPPTQPVFNTGPTPTGLAANGLPNGYFQLPNFEYITAERLNLGNPQAPGNFNEFPFLLNGDTASGFKALNPWPGP